MKPDAPGGSTTATGAHVCGGETEPADVAGRRRIASRGVSEDSAQHGICVWTVGSPALEQQNPSAHVGRTPAVSTVITARVRIAALRLRDVLRSIRLLIRLLVPRRNVPAVLSGLTCVAARGHVMSNTSTYRRRFYFGCVIFVTAASDIGACGERCGPLHCVTTDRRPYAVALQPRSRI